MKTEKPSPKEFGSRLNALPGLLTIGNALCGFTAILHIITAPAGQIPSISLWLIGVAVFFDMFDGWAARILNAQSEHGVHLDSMADAISFGLAPAVMIYHVTSNALPGPFHGLVWMATAFYLGTSLWHLAQFNTTASIEKPHQYAHFTGLPTPGAAGLVCCTLIVAPSLRLSETEAFSLYFTYTVFCSFLMIAPLHYPHLAHGLIKENKITRFCIIALIVVSLVIFKHWTIIAFAHIYVFYSPINAFQLRLARHLRKTIPTADLT